MSVDQSSVPDPTSRATELSEQLAHRDGATRQSRGELAELRTENKLLREKLEASQKGLRRASEKLDRDNCS